MSKKFFYCYNPRLAGFLKFYGLRWIVTGVNTKSNSKYWLFQVDDDLDKALIMYNELKDKTIPTITEE